MRIQSVYEITCECGRHKVLEDGTVTFTCECGRKSVIDFRAGFSEAELVKLLDGVMVQADRLSKVVEIVRDRRVA